MATRRGLVDKPLVSPQDQEVVDGSRSVLVPPKRARRSAAEDNFDAVVAAAPDAIVCTKADGHISLVNALAETMFGYERGELIGKPVEALVPERSRPAHDVLGADFVSGLGARPVGSGSELTGQRKDGSRFPAEVALASIDTDDGPIVMSIIRDITVRLASRDERQRASVELSREASEVQLHQAQRLESLGQLTGGVAHDFNNLLAVMLNYAAFVGDSIAAAPRDADSSYWDAVLRDVAQIVRAGERAADLTRQLLVFARRESVRPRIVDVNAVLGDLREMLRRTLDEKVDLQMQLAPDLWAVLADPGQIEQVLVNLVLNARDAMPTGGELVITTDNVVADEVLLSNYPHAMPGDYVRVRVNDDGVGMSTAVAGRAFEPFFTTKSEGEGSGLGLSTVHGIVSQAGGYARVQSALGVGSTFSVLLPASTVAPAASNISAPKVRGARGETVLVVGAQDALLVAAQETLVRNGYNLIAASSGEEALEAASSHHGKLDLLIADVIMPKMLGKEVAEILCELRPGLRVLYLSGYARSVLAARGALEPGVALLEKPFSKRALLAGVREILDVEGA